MSRSTPINQLPQQPEESGNKDLVKDILDQMENDNQAAEADYQKTQNAYHDQQFGVNPYDDGEEEMLEDDYYPEPTDFKSKVVNTVKEPLVVAVIFFVLSQKVVDGILKKSLARFEGHPYAGLMVLAIKAVLAGVVFYAVKRFT